MSSNPSSKWFWNDWDNDVALRLCSLAAQGLWMRMLSIAARSTPHGYVMINGRSADATDLAHVTGVSEAEIRCLIDELDARRVFSRDRHHRIYSRRMVRDERNRRAAVQNGKEGGNPEIRRGTVPKSQRIRPYRRSDNPAKTLRIFERDGGKCHWCGVELAFECDELVSNFFHVDHVLAVCDGGGNGETNLVAACVSCNHKRARVTVGSMSDVTVGRVAEDTAKRQKNKEDSADNNHDNKVALDPYTLSPTSLLPEIPKGISLEKPPQRRGTRLPTDFEVSQDWKEAGAKSRAEIGLPPINLEAEAAKFIDHWHAKAGKDGAKANWLATWRNWCRNARAGSESRINGTKPSDDLPFGGPPTGPAPIPEGGFFPMEGANAK